MCVKGRKGAVMGDGGSADILFPLPSLDPLTLVHLDLCQQNDTDPSRAIRTVEAFPRAREQCSVCSLKAQPILAG